MKNLLNLFYDEFDLLRVETRINSVKTFSFDKECPILLNKDEHEYEHESVCHSGVTSTLNFIRSKFWTVKGRQTAKNTLKKCFICKYVNRKTLFGQATPTLPDLRVKCNHSFEFVDVDFIGTIYCNVKNSVYKAYVLLFTCGVTRASNIELATDQSFAIGNPCIKKIPCKKKEKQN